MNNATTKPARVARLVAHLERSGAIPPTVDLEAVGYVATEWQIQKGAHRKGVRAAIYYVYTPHTPPHDVTIPLACSLPACSGTHAETVEFLRSHWLEDARAYLSR